MTAVRAEQRFSRNRRCPICAGADGDARGSEKRCHGFMSSDNKYAHCSREEHAGDLEAEDGGTYAHRLAGPCRCGATHGETERSERVIEATYDYRDERGSLLYQVVRFVGKEFRQRRPDGAGGWIWKLEGVRRVLYRLPELLAAPADSIVFVPEGEKDVEALRQHGLVATCNPQGAGKWKHVDGAALTGRNVVIIPDDDEPGRAHAADVQQLLAGITASTRICPLPAKDVSDWFVAGHDAAELGEIIASGLDDASTTTTTTTAARASYKRGSALLAPLRERQKLPWIELRLDEGGEPIVSGHAGAYVVFIGWEGSGKSSIILQIGIAAARAGLLFIYFTTELDAPEAAARVVGIIVGESWEGAARGRVHPADEEKALALPGFVVLAEDDATLENLERTINELRAEQPDRAIVLAVDYLQDLDVDGRDERAKVRTASRLIRRLAKKLRTFTIGVSQTSRDGRAELRSGKAIGADTATKGAESSQIERDGYVVLALGNPQEQPDGTIAMDLSVGKGRMRAGNQVYPLIYDGRTGRSRIAGGARSATDVRNERETERGKKKRETIKRAIVDLVSKSVTAMSKADITAKTEGGSTVIANAIKELIREGALAHDTRASRGGHPPIWTAQRIAEDASKEGWSA